MRERAAKQRRPERRPSSPAAQRSLTVQRRLAVGAATHPLELEADRVADEVMRMLRRSPVDSEAREVLGHSHPTRIVRHAGAGHHAHEPEVGLDGGDISPELSTRIQSASGGAPLAAWTLTRMESGFGTSFRDVRVHANSPLPAAVAADAFTTGRNIHFAPGRYVPGSAAGDHLLAHELTHVVQQGGAVARHASTRDCGHDVSRSIAEEITPSDMGDAIRRHSSWEHMLIGDLDPKSLATLGASQDTKDLRPTAKVYVGTDAQRKPIMVTKADVKHVIQQEINRLKRFQSRPPMFKGFAAMRKTEDTLKARDKRERVAEAKSDGGDQAAAAEAGKEWDLKLLAVPNNHGPAFLVTYGEMNTLGDYFGSVEEMKDVDHAWMSKLIRGIRQSTMHELMKVYTDISGFTDDVNAVGKVTKTARQKSRDELGIESEEFRAADGSTDLVELGGKLNELKLMGLPPGNQQTKPNVGGEAATDYSSTLARNACHFAPESWHAWFNFHTKARALAGIAWDRREEAFRMRAAMGGMRYSGDAQKDEAKVQELFAEASLYQNEAMVNNGFGDHYMQDSYAAGHLINKTLIMQHYVQWLDKNPSKWDFHRDTTWRTMQQMAYTQPELTAPSQHDKSKIGKRTLKSGKVVQTGRNPQTVENIKTNDWRDRAEALGLKPPSSLSNSDAKDLLVLWQTKCVTRAKIRRTRVQTYKTIRTWAADELHMDEDSLCKALSALFGDGIIRMGSYNTKDRITKHTLKPGTDLTLRDEFVPSSQGKLDRATADPAVFEDMAMGLAYNDYLEFMNDAFLQKATNFVHDKFCLEGLTVKAGNNEELFRIYGDDSMFKKNAGPGLLHSGTTSHLSRNSILQVATTGKADATAQQIFGRLPAEVRLDDKSVVPLETWHHGELLTKLEGGIFESMSEGAKTTVLNKGVGLKPTGLGKITAGARPAGHEVF
jgi:hypothetical protein